MTKKQKKRSGIPEGGALSIISTFLRHHAFIIVLCVVMVGLGTWLSSNYYQYTMNPDGMSYFSIAQKYAEGDIRHAINGYWGPLLSWLLVPAVWLDLNLTVAAKAVSLLASAAFLIALYHFLERRKVSRIISATLLLVSAITFFGWAVLGTITPDILIAVTMAMFAMALSDFVKRPSVRLGMWIGVLGALMYFSKGLGFFLCIGMVGLVGLWQMVKVDRAFWPVVRRLLPTIIAFSVLTLPFIAAISVKYDKLTINNAGAFNQHVNSPHYQGVQPIDVMGPLPLPNDSAVSPWEDPSIFVDLIPGWNPLSSGENLSYFYYSIFYNNLLASFRFLVILGPIMCVGLLVAVMGMVRKGKFQAEYTIFSLTTAMMFAAYIMVFILDRYLWGGLLLATAALGLWTQTLLDNNVVTKKQLTLAGSIICIIPLLLLGKQLVDAKYGNEIEYESAQNVKAVLPERAKVIADGFPLTNYACFQANLRCYNVIESRPIDQQEKYYQQLKKLGIKYFLYYHTRDNDLMLQEFIKTYMEPLDKKVDSPSPTIYRLQ